MPSVQGFLEHEGLLLDDDLFHVIIAAASGRKDRKITLANILKTLDRPRFIQAAAPTVNDDELVGVEVGNRWLDTTGPALYMCVDASEGAAVWETLADWS